MERHLPALVFLSILAFVYGSLLIIPGQDWLPLLVYFPVLTCLALTLFKKGIKPVDPDFPGSLFLLAFILKMVGGLVRYWIVADVYDFRADAPGYHEQGQYVAQYFRQFDFSILEHFRYRGEGTTNLVHVTGLFYTILPPSLPGMFFWFSGLALTGSVLFYRAFRSAFPISAPNFYRLIIFFLPSVLFWPSSLGKEAWIFFNIGLIAYGLAKYARQGHFSGLLLSSLGLYLIFIIRPHIAAFIVLAIGAAFLLALPGRRNRQHPLAWLVGGGLIVGLGLFVLPSAQEFVGIDEFSLEEFEDSYQFYQDNTAHGGSRYQTYSVLSPTGLILGTITVLFRPFPWEARNSQMLVTALEGTLWLGLVWTRRRVFWARIRLMQTDSWIIFLVFCSLIMILAFTTFGNFGILARQRTLFLPFFWMLFA